jgi:hypothetical protein
MYLKRRIYMKFTELAEVNDFLRTVDSCKGEVWLEST